LEEKIKNLFLKGGFKMEEKKIIIYPAYPSCVGCHPKIPERDCVSCRAPFRETMLIRRQRNHQLDQVAVKGWVKAN
jgi:hypothetical protein